MTPASGSCSAQRPPADGWTVLDLAPPAADLRADARAGLRASPKRLSSKYFYDARGSRLFEAITRQPEYYLTRVETALLEAVAPRIAQRVGPNVHVVELGTGSGIKTRQLLDALDDPVAYTSVEISMAALLDSTRAVADQFPHLQLLPVCADFTRPVPLPPAQRAANSACPTARAGRSRTFWPNASRRRSSLRFSPPCLRWSSASYSGSIPRSAARGSLPMP